MPCITGIQRRRRGRVFLAALYVDGERVGTVPRSLAKEAGLTAGLNISDAELSSLLAEAERREAVEVALRALEARPRSRAELRRRLQSRGYSEPAIEAALARCEELGHLDDVAFAAAWTRDRIRLKPRGRLQLESELRQKGVSDAAAQAGIDQAFRDEGVTELDLLEGVADRRWSALGRHPPDVARRRLRGYLRRRGFAHADIGEVLERLTHDR